ncbi:MAG: hypothetical protein SGARI_001496 [Bacillariaceae sp.]
MNGDNYLVQVEETRAGLEVHWKFTALVLDSNGGAPKVVAYNFFWNHQSNTEGSCHPEIVDPAMNVVPDDLILLLCCRIVHFILRQHISEIGNDELKISSLFSLLQSTYAKEKEWWDAHDLSVLRARYVLLDTRPQSDMLPRDRPYRALRTVAMTLMGVKEWDRAAEMFLTASESVSDHDSSVVMGVLIRNAGAAKKLAGKYDDAEKQLVRAFPFFLKDTTAALFDPNEKVLSNAIDHLMALYAAHIASNGAVSVVNSELSKVAPPLFALLHLAGWDKDGEACYGQKCYEMNVLKSRIHNKKQAKKFLYRALMLGDATKFRSLVLEVTNLHQEVCLFSDPSNSFNQNEKNTRQSNKKIARSALQSQQ